MIYGESDPHRVLSQGPQIVVIGGGHGLSTLLRGLKTYTANLTAIVTVTDDGGGSGVLRQELDMPAPGDIRNCMQALSGSETLMERLLEYRFPTGSLAGQSFGNLLLAALNGIFPTFDQAVAGMHQVLNIAGRVLPVTAENVRLEALLENGVRVLGESNLSQCKQEQNCRIRRVFLRPQAPKALPEALEAIGKADLVILGPGSLYTSVIPNLLVRGIPEALRETAALRLYVVNVMTEAGETEGYTAGDHIAALQAHGGEQLFSICLANNAYPSAQVLACLPHARPVVIDRDRLSQMDVEVVDRPLAGLPETPTHHHPLLLTQAIREIYEERSVRVFSGPYKPRYIRES